MKINAETSFCFARWGTPDTIFDNAEVKENLSPFTVPTKPFFWHILSRLYNIRIEKICIYMGSCGNTHAQQKRLNYITRRWYWELAQKTKRNEIGLVCGGYANSLQIYKRARNCGCLGTINLDASMRWKSWQSYSQIFSVFNWK